MYVYIYTFICIYACVCICMYIYIYIHTYIYLCIYLFIYLFIGTGEILVKGWHLLSEECLWFRKNAAHFEGSPNLKQYILHHVQGNAAFFSQKCCALLDMFFAHSDATLSCWHGFSNAHDMLRDYFKRMCCTF